MKQEAEAGRGARLSVAPLQLMLLQLIMDLLPVLLPVLLVCAEAQNLTQVTVILGQPVLLNCSVNSSDLYWYVEIHSQVRAFIVHSFSFGRDFRYHISAPGGKYEAVPGGSLWVRNITAEDCRLYLCARKLNDKLVFEEAFRIVLGQSKVSLKHVSQTAQSFSSPSAHLQQTNLTLFHFSSSCQASSSRPPPAGARGEFLGKFVTEEETSGNDQLV